jgi:hypothetical protein
MIHDFGCILALTLFVLSLTPKSHPRRNVMRSLILFVMMTAACEAQGLGFKNDWSLQKNPAAPPPTILSTPSGGMGRDGFYSRAPGGLIGPGGFLMDGGGAYIDQRGTIIPKVGPVKEDRFAPYRSRSNYNRGGYR